MSWLESLPEPQRESVYAEMRRFDEQAEHAMRQFRFLAGGGGIPVCAAHFDEYLVGDSLRMFLRQIHRGFSPQKACELAKTDARELIENHNQKRPKDINWKRADIAADSRLEHCCRVLLAAVKNAVPEQKAA